MSSISSKAHKNIWTVEQSTMLSWLLMILLMTPSVKSWNQRNSFRYVLVGIGNQNTKQLGRSKLGGILLNGLLSQISVSCLPTYFMRKRGKFVLLIYWILFSKIIIKLHALYRVWWKINFTKKYYFAATTFSPSSLGGGGCLTIHQFCFGSIIDDYRKGFNNNFGG